MATGSSSRTCICTEEYFSTGEKIE